MLSFCPKYQKRCENLESSKEMPNQQPLIDTHWPWTARTEVTRSWSSSVEVNYQHAWYGKLIAGSSGRRLMATYLALKIDYPTDSTHSVLVWQSYIRHFAAIFSAFTSTLRFHLDGIRFFNYINCHLRDALVSFCPSEEESPNSNRSFRHSELKTFKLKVSI